jgi:hypothetical protein
MATCHGTLVVHEDATPVWCSEELTGGTCADYTFEHHRAFVSCRVAFRLGCPDCDPRNEFTGAGVVARALVGMV